ncbi:transposase InsO family protein [Bradyrhizobium elkanii]
MRFTDERKYFVSEASVYRLLKAHDLITSPVYVVIKAANEIKDKTTAPSRTGQGFSATMVRVTWRMIWPSGSTRRACSTCARAPYHPQTQGKIERWHQTLKNRKRRSRPIRKGLAWGLQSVDQRVCKSLAGGMEAATTENYEVRPNDQLVDPGLRVTGCDRFERRFHPDVGLHAVDFAGGDERSYARP